jgi:hypothetical protein
MIFDYHFHEYFTACAILFISFICRENVTRLGRNCSSVTRTSCFQDEDEWKEFEEEKKDYSGLKIGHLTINDSLDAESDDERGNGENSSDGESGEGGTKHTGPWKKPDLPPEVPVEVTAPPAPPAPTGNTSYKAPHLRNQPSFASPRPRGRNVAPDINSEEYFPTLNSKPQQTNNGSTPWGRRYGKYAII